MTEQKPATSKDFNAIKPRPWESMTDEEHLICVGQAKLFALAGKMNFDATDFCEKYMASEFCNSHIDTDCDYYQMADAGYNMEVLLDEINPVKAQMECYPATAEYIGYMYQYLHRRSGIPSRDLYKRFSYSEMEKYCLMSINEDPEETLYDIMDDYSSLFPEVTAYE